MLDQQAGQGEEHTVGDRLQWLMAGLTSAAKKLQALFPKSPSYLIATLLNPWPVLLNTGMSRPTKSHYKGQSVSISHIHCFS